MKKFKNIFSTMALSLLFLIAQSCGGKKDAETIDNPEASGKSNLVELSVDQYKQIGIKLDSFRQKNLTDVLKATGFLKVPPQNKASITSALGGTVQSILVQEGDHVSKGQTVATLTNPEFITMQQEFLESKSNLVFAEAEYNRQKELNDQNVGAQKTFQQAEAAYRGLQAKVNSLQSKLELLNINTKALTQDNIVSAIPVVSPINGNISEIDVNIGTNVQPETVLMDIVDNSQLHLDLFVFEQDLPSIKVGQAVDFTLTNLAGKNYSATIFSIGSAFENETKTIPVHAAITGEKSGLIEGMNVTALIDVGDTASPSVPETALINSGGNDYIFILHADRTSEGKYTFERVQVKKGISDAGYTQIVPLKPLDNNVQIVVSGSFYLMAMLTNTGEEE